MTTLRIHDAESGWYIVHRVQNGRIATRVRKEARSDTDRERDRQRDDEEGGDEERDDEQRGGRKPRGQGEPNRDPRGGNPWRTQPDIDDGLAPGFVAPRRWEREFEDWSAFERHLSLLQSPTEASFIVHGPLPEQADWERAFQALPPGSHVAVLMRHGRV